MESKNLDKKFICEECDKEAKMCYGIYGPPIVCSKHSLPMMVTPDKKYYLNNLYVKYI